MVQRAAVVLALLALAVAPAVTVARQLAAARDDFDFFLLVRQWPGSFCGTHACPLLKDRDWARFTIHGMWPNRWDGTWPEFCAKDWPFDDDDIEDLEHDLEALWPSYMDASSSESFWAHEWNRHGTCALSLLPSEHQFFKTVLSLAKKYDLRAALDAAGVTPSSTVRYPKAKLEGAVQTAFGVEALFHCDSQGQLTEVWMCFDKALKPIDCKVSASEASRCSQLALKPIPGGTPWSAKAAEEEHKDEHNNHDDDHVADSLVQVEGLSLTEPEQIKVVAAVEPGVKRLRDGAAVKEEEGKDSNEVDGTAPLRRARRVPSYQSSELARTLSIAAAGSVLAGVVMVTLVSSWARRRAPGALGAEHSTRHGGAALHGRPLLLPVSSSRRAPPLAAVAEVDEGAHATGQEGVEDLRRPLL